MYFRLGMVYIICCCLCEMFDVRLLYLLIIIFQQVFVTNYYTYCVAYQLCVYMQISSDVEYVCVLLVE